MKKTTSIYLVSTLIIVGGIVVYSNIRAPLPIETQPTETSTKSDHTAITKESETPHTEALPQTVATPVSSVHETVITQDRPISDTTKYTIPVLSNTTVLEAMNAHAATDSGFSVSGRNFPGLGFFLEEISGKKNADGFYWTLFINNKIAEQGASSAEVTPNDTVIWKYQKGI